MPKSQPNQTLLFAGACVLGALLFVGGFELRERTDPLSRVRPTVSNTRDSDGFTVSRHSDGQQIPLSDFYAAMTDLLKNEYVEPIKDDQKLASGAVRGMVLSLGDPRSTFMDADLFKAYVNKRAGRYEGIGAEFDLRGVAPTPKKIRAGEEAIEDPKEAALFSRVPYLVVTMVVPGGPADKAGVQPGDVVTEIDKHWVVDGMEIAQFNQATKLFAAKKIPFAQISKLQKSLKAKFERSLMPAKAKEKLILGERGNIAIKWKRGNAIRNTSIARGVSEMSSFAEKDGANALRFDANAPTMLKEAIDGKSEVRLDLRNNVDGDFESMKSVLSVLAPNGTYGSIATMRKEPSSQLTVTHGNPNPPKITILVDKTTRGPAAILARALEAKRLATLVGGPTGSDLSIRQVVGLPDGSGYTLVTGEYQTSTANTKIAFAEAGE